MAKINYKYIKFDNFSNVRNKSLDMATTDYVIWMDADDTMQTPEGIRDLILHYPDADVLKCKIHSQTEQGTREVIVHNRIFKNKKEYRFRNKVHEDISFSMLENSAQNILTDLTINHYGYVDKKAWKKKNIRNYNLLLQDTDRHSLWYYAIVNCLIILGGIENGKKAIGYIDECFEKCGLKPEDPLTPKMWVLRGIICMDAKQDLAAKQAFHKAFDEWKHPEAAVNLAELYMREQKYDKAIEILKVIYEMKEFKMTNVSFDPIHAELLMLKKLGDCYWFKAAGEKDNAAHVKLLLQAEQHYREHMSIRKYDLETADRLCDVLRRTGRIGEANIITVAMINKYPNYAAGWFNISQTELMNKRFVTTELFLKECLRWKPDYQEAKHNLNEVRRVLYGNKKR